MRWAWKAFSVKRRTNQAPTPQPHQATAKAPHCTHQQQSLFWCTSSSFFLFCDAAFHLRALPLFSISHPHMDMYSYKGQARVSVSPLPFAHTPYHVHPTHHQSLLPTRISLLFSFLAIVSLPFVVLSFLLLACFLPSFLFSLHRWLYRRKRLWSAGVGWINTMSWASACSANFSHDHWPWENL